MCVACYWCLCCCPHSTRVTNSTIEVNSASSQRCCQCSCQCRPACICDDPCCCGHTKDFSVARALLILGLCTGVCGLHRCYLGDAQRGWLWFVTCTRTCTELFHNFQVAFVVWHSAWTALT